MFMNGIFNHPLRSLACLAVALLCAASPLKAGFADGTGPGMPEPIYVPDAEKSVSVQEHLNSSLPLDAWFTDETGKSIQLKEFFSGSRKPVVLQIGYFRCPMLCSEISKNLVDSLKQVRLDAGPDYDVVFVSIDPRETPELAAQKKESFLKAYARDGSESAWHLLTGNKLQIDRVTDATGIGYEWVGRAQQYSHPAVTMVISPQGKICRYLYGTQFDPQTLRLSMVEASNEKIGTTTDDFILTCFQFDGLQGKYAMRAIKMMKVGGLLTVLIVGGLIFRVRRHGPHADDSRM